MSERVKLASDYSARYSQGHLDSYLKPYHRPESESLAGDILSVDLRRMSEILKEATRQVVAGDPQMVLEPADVMISYEASPKERNDLISEGLQLINRGKAAVVTMAGGQGSRLGHNGPKGTFVLPLKEPKSLFRIQCEGLIKVGMQAGKMLPWFIMTSHDNHDATVSYFVDNDFLGYDRSLVRFFPQNEVPVVDREGRLLVRNNRIVRAADGNGGIFAALASSGNIKVLEEHGVERVFICGIDNALIQMADPLFLGFSAKTGKPIASKSVLKRSFDENAGVFCRKNGRPYYIEYTEIPEEKARMTDSSGQLVFGDAGIVAYVYDTKLLRRLADKPLPYHPAHKKIAYSLPDGTPVDPDQPNAIKFESFIFDSFEYADDVAVMRVDRKKEFAPIKKIGRASCRERV